MALYASGVQIPADLSGALSGQGSPGYNASATIGANYANAKNKLARGASTMGMNGPAATGPNSYGGNQLTMAQSRDTGNLEAALGSGLGTTAYNNQLQQREFGQNEQLAEETAALNKPDMLQQILGGIGSVGGTAAGIYGAFGKNASPPPSYGPGGPTGGNLSLLQGYGGSRYGF